MRSGIQHPTAFPLQGYYANLTPRPKTWHNNPGCKQRALLGRKIASHLVSRAHEKSKAKEYHRSLEILQSYETLRVPDPEPMSPQTLEGRGLIFFSKMHPRYLKTLNINPKHLFHMHVSPNGFVGVCFFGRFAQMPTNFRGRPQHS